MYFVRPLTCSLLGIVLLLAAVGPIATADVTDPTPSVTGATVEGRASIGGAGFESATRASGAALQRATEAGDANDTTTVPHHENPNEESRDGDLLRVRGWLADNLGVELETCTQRLASGSVNVCELADQYPEWVRKYVDVAEETDDSDDDQAGESFRDAQQSQQNYSERVSEFRQTQRDYENAREAGNESRARSHARELIRIGNGVNATGARLIADYDAISNRTSVNLSDASETVRDINRNVSETTATVRETLFVDTTLTLQANATTVSFLRPLELTGRLAAENGTVVANEPVHLRVGTRSVRTRTNATGEFTIQYRPTLLPANATSLSARYVPSAESPYLESNASVPVSVARVTPTVSVSRTPTTVAFGERVTVAGRVAAADLAAPSVPVVVTVDGTVFGQTRTTQDGRFAVSTRLPATVPTGEHTVRVEVAARDRALARANGTATVDVTSTPTRLNVSASRDGTRQFVVEGQLRTAEGRPIGSQVVTLRVNNSTSQTVRTNADGSYRADVAVSQAVVDSDSSERITVVARFDGQGTNLRDSVGSTIVRVTQSTSEENGSDGIESIVRTVSDWGLLEWGLILGGVAFVLALGLTWAVTSGSITSAESSVGSALATLRSTGQWSAGATAEQSETEADSETATDERAGEDATSALGSARAKLTDGDADGALIVAYAQLRQRVADRLSEDSTSGMTHWEFFLACEERENAFSRSQVAVLRRLTEAYEHAAFAADSLAAERTAELLDDLDAFEGVGSGERPSDD